MLLDAFALASMIEKLTYFYLSNYWKTTVDSSIPGSPTSCEDDAPSYYGTGLNNENIFHYKELCVYLSFTSCDWNSSYLDYIIPVSPMRDRL